MTPALFRKRIVKIDEDLVDLCVRPDVIPYVFEPDQSTWHRFRDEFVGRLGVKRGEITIIGSARFGFSTKPQSDLRTFTERSDIDVAVISRDLFDKLWLNLLRAAYPRGETPRRLGGWLRQRQAEVYTGWITPRNNPC